MGGGHGSCPIALTSGWRLSRDVTLLLVPRPAVPAAGHVWLPRPDHGCPQTSRLPRVSPALSALAGPLSCPQTLAAPRDTPRVSAGRQGLCRWPTSSCSLIVVSQACGPHLPQGSVAPRVLPLGSASGLAFPPHSTLPRTPSAPRCPGGSRSPPPRLGLACSPSALILAINPPASPRQAPCTRAVRAACPVLSTPAATAVGYVREAPGPRPRDPPVSLGSQRKL